MMSNNTSYIDQTTILNKMKEFLSYIQNADYQKESLQDDDGMCNGFSFMLFRADLANERQKYFERLKYISESDTARLKKMARLHSEYTFRFSEEVKKEQSQYLKQVKDCKNENDKKILRKHHYDQLEKKVVNSFGVIEQDILNHAQDLYIFISSLLFSHNPDLFDKNNKTVNQHDYLEILDIIPPDNYSVSASTVKPLSLTLNFTKEELKEIMKDIVDENDQVQIYTPGHAMYLLDEVGSFSPYDPNDKVIGNTNREDFINTTVDKYFDETKNKRVEREDPVYSFSFYINKNKKLNDQINKKSALDDIAGVFSPIPLVRFLPHMYAFKKQLSFKNKLKEQGEKIEDFINRKLEKNISTNNIDRKNIQTRNTDLMIAAKMGNIKIVKKLLENKANPNSAASDGFTAAHHAAYNDHKEILIELANHKADLNKTNNSGYTPLHSALISNSLELIKLLFKLKANFNVKDKSQSTIQHNVAELGNLPIIKYFTEVLKLDPDQRNGIGSRPSHFAAQNGHLPILRFFSELKIDLNCPNDEGLTQLHYAAQKDHLHVVRYLIETLHVDANPLDNNGETPAHWAAQNGHTRTCIYLAKHNADFRAQGFLGNTPLYYAAINGHWQTVFFMLHAVCEQERLSEEEYKQVSFENLMGAVRIEQAQDILNHFLGCDIIGYAPEIMPFITSEVMKAKMSPIELADSYLNTSVKSIALALDNTFSPFLKYISESKNNAFILCDSIMRQDNDNGDTGLHTIALHAPEMLMDVLRCAIQCRKGLSTILEALSIENNEGVTGWQMVSKHASHYKNDIINLIKANLKKQTKQNLRKLSRELHESVDQAKARYRGLCKDSYLFFGTQYRQTDIWKDITDQVDLRVKKYNYGIVNK